MLRTDYLNPHTNPAVAAFVNWLAIQISSGAPPLAFPPNPGALPPAFPTIMDAFAAYSWPTRRTTIHFPVPPTPVVLPAHSRFPANSAVLERCAVGLPLAIGHAPMLADWISTVWQWGGVAKPTSLSWLNTHANICVEVAGVLVPLLACQTMIQGYLDCLRDFDSTQE